MNDGTTARLPADVSARYPIPEYTTWWWGDHWSAVHTGDGSVIRGDKYRDLVTRCFLERTRRQGIEMRAGVYLLGVGGDYPSGPGG
ncbi:hypothetical protein Acsp03_24540 [Actinomadura sp. NBRC 104412]|uniref:hypothetical protein n=1 Tax=Actinomadura sp. NBRC 104412 TaxID=3032203 RepID=UPI0024A23F1B|nr:hypothetical protein [Actinomadura sp. NBRC 104412]GLZ04988.1 hypothetical protein Acsp03_24540 [Actinomadura sp. NBRC 104412]